MTVYREGQRVRIEWPDAVVEDTATFGPHRGEWYGKRTSLGLDGAWIKDGRVVTILAEPKPDEPTGVGAVARGPAGELWVRVHAGAVLPWLSIGHGLRYPRSRPPRHAWDQIEVVEVLSPGVDVDALDVIDAEAL